MSITPDPIEPVSVALDDLRATLEAQIRHLTAAQACLGYHRQNPTGGALVDCAEHLQRFSGLSEGSAAGYQDAVTALKRILDVPSAFVLLSPGSSNEH